MGSKTEEKKRGGAGWQCPCNQANEISGSTQASMRAKPTENPLGYGSTELLPLRPAYRSPDNSILPGGKNKTKQNKKKGEKGMSLLGEGQPAGHLSAKSQADAFAYVASPTLFPATWPRVQVPWGGLPVGGTGGWACTRGRDLHLGVDSGTGRGLYRFSVFLQVSFPAERPCGTVREALHVYQQGRVRPAPHLLQPPAFPFVILLPFSPAAPVLAHCFPPSQVYPLQVYRTLYAGYARTLRTG